MPLQNASFHPLDDREFLARVQFRTFKIMAESDCERERFVSIGREMVAKMEGKVEEEHLAEIDETGMRGGVATKAQLVCSESDSEDEVWI